MAPTAVTGVANVLELQPEQLVALIEDRLDDAPFISPTMGGNFTVAGGVFRSPNVSIEGEGGALFGSGSIRLPDLGITGDYTLTPTTVAPAALVDANTARVTTRLSGTLTEPQRVFDVSGLVDAIMVKAFEAEVARLEKLRAEEEARLKAEADEKARLAAEEAARKAAAEAEARRLADEARLKAEQEARLKAEQEAARKAAEDAAAKQAAEEAARQEEELRKALEEFNNRPMDIGLGN